MIEVICMEGPSISAKILKVESISDEWGVFEQNLLIELKNGTILRVEDNDKKITSQDIEKQKKLTLLVFLPHIEKIKEQNFSINSKIRDCDEKNKDYDSQITGKIMEINHSRDTIHLDVGIGSLIIDVHSFEIADFTCGDFVKIQAARIDLNAIFPNKQNTMSKNIK
jgi:hypothetical protein